MAFDCGVGRVVFASRCMKRWMLLFVFSLACLAIAGDAKSILVQPGTVVAQPDLRQPLGPEWKSPYGTWEVKEGEMVVTSGVFKLRPGEPVVIDNSLAPEAKLAPKPKET